MFQISPAYLVGTKRIPSGAVGHTTEPLIVHGTSGLHQPLRSAIERFEEQADRKTQWQLSAI